MYGIIIVVKETDFCLESDTLDWTQVLPISKLQTWTSYGYTRAITANWRMGINGDSTSHRTK